MRAPAVKLCTPDWALAPSMAFGSVEILAFELIAGGEVGDRVVAEVEAQVAADARLRLGLAAAADVALVDALGIDGELVAGPIGGQHAAKAGL